MIPEVIRLLVLDDDDDDYFITREMLQRTACRYIFSRAATVAEAERKLAEEIFDVAIVDYDLGAESGLEFIRQQIAAGQPVPFILLTGRGTIEVDLEAIQAGAAVYLNKNEVSGAFLERSIRFAVERRRADQERERLTDENRRQRQLLERIFEISPTGLALIEGPELTVTMMNAAYRAILPHPEQDPLGRRLEELFSLREGFHAAEWAHQVYHTHQPFSADRLERFYPDGSRKVLSLRILPLIQTPGAPILMVSWETTPFEDAFREAEEGKRILDALMAYIPAGINVYEQRDGELKMTAASRYLERLAGMTTEDLLGLGKDQVLSTWQLYREGDATPVPDEEWPYNQVTRTGEEILSKSFVLAGPTGQYSILTNCGPIKDQAGNLIGTIVAFVDNQEQKQLEAELRRAEQKTRSILNSITDSYFQLDRNWCYVDINEQACRYLDKQPEDLLGKRIWDVYPAQEHSYVGEYYRQAVATGLPVHFELRSISVPRWAEVHAYPDEAGLAIYWKDITARKQAELERERQAEEMRAIFAAITDAVMVYNAECLPVYANPPAVSLLGFDPTGQTTEQYRQKLALVALDGQPVPVDQLPLTRALQGETTTGMRFRLQVQGQPDQILRVSASPLRQGDQITGAVVAWNTPD